MLNLIRPVKIVLTGQHFMRFFIPLHFCVHIVIPPFCNSGIIIYDSLSAWAVFVIVVDDATGLQVGVDCYRSHILEPPFLQNLAYLFRQTIAYRDFSQLMPLIKYGLAFGKCSNI